MKIQISSLAKILALFSLIGAFVIPPPQVSASESEPAERDDAMLAQLRQDYLQEMRAFRSARREWILSHPDLTPGKNNELKARFTRDNLAWRIVVAEKAYTYRDALMYAPPPPSRRDRNEARAEMQGIMRQTREDLLEQALLDRGESTLTTEERRTLRAYREAARELIDLEMLPIAPDEPSIHQRESSRE